MAGLGLWIRKLLFTVKIEGESMWPALVPGRLYWASGILKPGVNDFIIFRNPNDCKEVFIKRVDSVSRGGYRVSGLVSWSASSNDFGLVDKKLILGKLLKGFVQNSELLGE